ncbi:MAG: hypothetical protein BroJett012_07390 [Betaproteobacteria bacterium]|jgi:hypothetical protein|nr:MAG: hypothetical protein BroJett012_07390 [Betaproteobacteria bacterium]
MLIEQSGRDGSSWRHAILVEGDADLLQWLSEHYPQGRYLGRTLVAAGEWVLVRISWLDTSARRRWTWFAVPPPKMTLESCSTVSSPSGPEKWQVIEIPDDTAIMGEVNEDVSRPTPCQMEIIW